MNNQEQIELLKQMVEQQHKAQHDRKVLIFWVLGLVFLIFFPPLLIPWGLYGVIKLLQKAGAKAVEIGKRDKVLFDKLDDILDKKLGGK